MSVGVIIGGVNLERLTKVSPGFPSKKKKVNKLIFVRNIRNYKVKINEKQYNYSFCLCN